MRGGMDRNNEDAFLLSSSTRRVIDLGYKVRRKTLVGKPKESTWVTCSAIGLVYSCNIVAEDSNATMKATVSPSLLSSQ